MRTATLELNGKERLLCFSARVVRSCTERYGDVAEIDSALSESGVKGFDEALWLLSEMMVAGDRYAKLNGLDNPPPLGVEELLDLCDLHDFGNLRGKIAETITCGQKTTVGVEPPKNAGATQDG